MPQLERDGACSAEASLPQSPTSSFGSRLRRAVWLAVSGPGVDAPRFAPSSAQTCSARRPGALPRCRVEIRLLRAKFLRTSRSARRRTTLPSALGHAEEGKGRAGCLPIVRRGLLSVAVLAASVGLAGCGSTGPTPAQREASSIAHEIVCGGANKLGKERYCEHPALVEAEERERKRQEPAVVKAEETEEAKTLAAEEGEEQHTEGGLPKCKTPSESGCIEPGTG